MMEYPTRQERWIGIDWSTQPSRTVVQYGACRPGDWDALRQWYTDQFKAKTHIEHCMGVAYVVWDEVPTRRVEIQGVKLERKEE